jgi:hypothetical protein
MPSSFTSEQQAKFTEIHRDFENGKYGRGDMHLNNPVWHEINTLVRFILKAQRMQGMRDISEQSRLGARNNEQQYFSKLLATIEPPQRPSMASSAAQPTTEAPPARPSIDLSAAQPTTEAPPAHPSIDLSSAADSALQNRSSNPALDDMLNIIDTETALSQMSAPPPSAADQASNPPSELNSDFDTSTEGVSPLDSHPLRTSASSQSDLSNSDDHLSQVKPSEFSVAEMDIAAKLASLQADQKSLASSIAEPQAAPQSPRKQVLYPHKVTQSRADTETSMPTEQTTPGHVKRFLTSLFKSGASAEAGSASAEKSAQSPEVARLKTLQTQFAEITNSIDEGKRNYSKLGKNADQAAQANVKSKFQQCNGKLDVLYKEALQTSGLSNKGRSELNHLIHKIGEKQGEVSAALKKMPEGPRPGPTFRS